MANTGFSVAIVYGLFPNYYNPNQINTYKCILKKKITLKLLGLACSPARPVRAASRVAMFPHLGSKQMQDTETAAQRLLDHAGPVNKRVPI